MDIRTLKALLAVPLTQLAPGEYRFCLAPACPTVYYDADGRHCFDEAAVREKVFQKHTDADEVLVCYCFQHTVGSIRAELALTGTTSVTDHILAGTRAGQCACDIRNPQGTCCLGNVRHLVRRLRRGLAGSAATEALHE